MSGVIVNYNNNALTSMSSSGTKTLLTSGKYCEGNFEVVYSEPSTSSLTVTPTETAQTFNATGVYGYKPVTVNGVSSTYVGTGIARKSSTDTTFTSTTGTFTAPVGYYSTAATKTLTTQAAQTIYPSTVDQTIASHRWLTGAQTIKSVTTSNLTAENIAEGVVVKVGDATNASRIAQITGTHSGAPKYTATIISAGVSSAHDAPYCYVKYPKNNGSKYAKLNTTIEFSPGDEMLLYAVGYSNTTPVSMYINDELVSYSTMVGSYLYTLPSCDINISLNAYTNPIGVKVYSPIIPSDTLSISSNGTYNVYGYSSANVNVPKYTATIGSLSINGNEIYYNSSRIYQNTSFNYNAGDTLVLELYGTMGGCNIYEDGVRIAGTDMGSPYSYILPSHDITLYAQGGGAGTCYINAVVPSGYIKPSGVYDITSNGVYDVTNYVSASVNVPLPSALAFPTATSGTRVGNVIANLYPSSTNQFLNIPVGYNSSSGAYVINHVTTTNLTASNIAEGVTVKIGDSDNESRIAQITGAHSGLGSEPYRCYIISNESPNLTTPRVKYGGKEYRSAGSNFLFNAGDSIELQARGAQGGGKIFIDGRTVSTSAYGTASYTYTPATNFDVLFSGYIEVELYVNTYTPTSEISGGGFTVDDIAMRSISGDISGSARNIKSYAFHCCYSLTTANFPNATSIGGSAFYNCISLTTASFPSATSIGNFAFYSCTSLTTVSFPSATSIGSYAFSYCSALTTASFPKATYIGSYTFNYCTKLITVSFPSATIIGNYAFAACYSLTTASFPNVTSIGSYAFNYCYLLTTVSFPSATIIGNSAFNSCYSLTTVSFPNVTSIGSYAFYSCSALTTAYFPNATSIGNFAFRSCFNLLSFYLLGSSIPTLGASVFYSTPIGGYTTGNGYGSIFVPASLYSSYLTATNWSVYSSRIVSV